jgi:DNA-binding transcriptional LysR family regulator
MSRRIRYKDLQLTALRSFCLVAREGNFSKAAVTLELSTSAVWQQVRSLERMLKAPLLRRRGRSVELTEEGGLLLELAQPHVSGLDSLIRLFEARRSEVPRQVKVASIPYLLSYHLPRAVQAFTAAHPKAQLVLRVGLVSEVLQLVSRGETDVGVVAYDRDEARDPQLRYEDLFIMRFTLMTSARHPLARKKRLSPHDLVQYPIIIGPRTGYDYKLLEHLLERHGLVRQLSTVIETGNTDIIAKYAALGIGIALAHVGPEVSLDIPGLHLRPVDPQLAGIPVAMVVHKGAHQPEVVEALRHCVRRFLADATAGPAEG